MFGDSLAAAGTFGASIVILNGEPKVGTIIMVIAVLGKFISNFFSDEISSWIRSLNMSLILGIVPTILLSNPKATL
jgi:hypothetical protein